MDNLKLQTVYVPVPDEPAMGHVVWYGDTYDTNVQKLNDRIVLTPGELHDLLLEYHPGITNDPKPFLKDKGIVIADHDK